MQNVRDKNNNGPNDTSSVYLVDDLPRDALVWLRKYGLTNKEALNFRWDPGRERLVVGITRADKMVFWQGRRFGKEGPKYLSWGQIPWDPPMHFGDSGSVIFVEDVVSAIKVGRHATGVPLFGSHVPAEALKWAQEQGRPVVIWLDPDKNREALKQALRATANGVRTNVIWSDKDPKELSDLEIRAKIDNSWHYRQVDGVV